MKSVYGERSGNVAEVRCLKIKNSKISGLELAEGNLPGSQFSSNLNTRFTFIKNTILTLPI